MKSYENLSTEVKIDVLKSFDDIVQSIAETWEFMTGSPMPDDAVQNAYEATRGAAKQHPLWPLRLMHEAYSHGLLSGHAARITGNSVNGDPEIITDVVSSLDLPEADPVLINLLQQLGDAILDSAYLTLGEGVEDEISTLNVLLRETECSGELTDEDKIDLIIYTVGRLLVRLTSRSPERIKSDIFYNSGERVVNHPLRLSPYTIRNVGADVLHPTCLSLSIIIASFLSKCEGVDNLYHVGVPTPLSWPFAAMVEGSADLLHRHALNYPDMYPDKLRTMLEQRIKSANKISANWDPHSAVIFTVGSHSVLYDPYQDMNIYLSDKATFRDLAIHADLSGNATGVELIVNPDTELTAFDHALEGAESLEYLATQELPTVQRWRDALHFAAEDGSPQPLIDVLDTIVSHGGDRSTFGSYLSSSLGFSLEAQHLADDEADLEEFIKLLRDNSLRLSNEFIEQMVGRQVFWLDNYNPNKDQGLLVEALIRCKTDERYFERRVEDLILWPFRLVLAMQQHTWKYVEGVNAAAVLPHIALEVGDISHRIGACSLLDVTYGFGEPLPLSFWVTHTASQLPWLYAAQTRAESTADDDTVNEKLFRIMHEIVQVSSWRYRQIVSII